MLAVYIHLESAIAAFIIDLTERTGLYAILVASVLGMMAIYPRPEGIKLFTNWKKNFMSFLGGLGIAIEFIVALLSFPFICAWFSRSKVVCLGLFYVAIITVAKLFFTETWELGVVAGIEYSTSDPNPPKEAQDFGCCTYPSFLLSLVLLAARW